MDKKTFKSSFFYLVHMDVIGLSNESKIQYMKKWIRDYEAEQEGSTIIVNSEKPIKIGLLVRTTLRNLVSNNSLSEEQIRLLQDKKYCKNTFDINYPFLNKVIPGSSLSQQRKINGYDRYWEEPISINGEKFFVCNDWYEKNRSKFNTWVKYFKL